MKLQKIVSHLQKLHPKEIDLSLDRVKNLCKKLGNPQENLKFISVVGTNGKYSTIQAIRAILKDAPILLLDEATSSLDPETENEINKTLEKLTKNKTTITIAHKLSTIINSDQIILLSKGKIVNAGSHKELMKSSDHYKKLFQAGN